MVDNLLHLRKHPRRPVVRSESRNGTRRRLRDAAQKLPHSKEQPTRIEPMIPPVVTHHDDRDAHHTHAGNHAIAVRDNEQISSIIGESAALEADLAASEDELKILHVERTRRDQRQETFEAKVEAEG